MNINFPPVDEKFIKSKIEEGYYSNATELVRDAVRRLREKDADVPSSNSERYEAWFVDEVTKGLEMADSPNAIWHPHQSVKAKLAAKKGVLQANVGEEAA